MHPADEDALSTDEKIWDLTMQINLKGVWWGSKYAIQAMRQNPTDTTLGLHTGGSIINTASFVAIMGAATPQLACEFPSRTFSIDFSKLDAFSLVQILLPRARCSPCHASLLWSMLVKGSGSTRSVRVP